MKYKRHGEENQGNVSRGILVTFSFSETCVDVDRYSGEVCHREEDLEKCYTVVILAQPLIPSSEVDKDLSMCSHLTT